MSGKKTRVHFLSLIATLVFLVFGQIAQAGELRIWIKEKARVTDDTVTLGDIASFTPEQDERVPALRERRVAAAPAPGRDLVMNSRFLIYRLSSLLGGDPQVRVKVPESLVVQRPGQVISAKKMTDIFRQYIFSHSPRDRKKMEIERMHVPGSLTLPCGRLSWEIQDRGEEDFAGDISRVISFSVDGRIYRKVPVSCRILVSRKVIKTVRKIARGQVIGPQDLVEVTEQSIRSDRNDVIHLNQITGRRAARSLQAGQTVTRGMVEIPPTVRKGDRVIIKAESSSVVVSALGKVMEDGRSGEQVRVINVSSGKQIFATVLGPGQVRVSF
jgi:flagella basal body P-ring formation protein FlgA